MENLKILLIGQPNVGKSSLLNVLVGPRVTVSNYPGTTVEVVKAKKKINNIEIEFLDTPGIYSISDRSEEEKITEKVLFERKIDAAIVVADATSLERSLYMVLQILEAQIPIVLAINFIEDAQKKGIEIDVKKLEKYLNIPVLSINPLTKMGINKLMEIIILKKEKIARRGFKIRYDDHIEEAINNISVQVEGKLPKRFIALRVLEKDEDFYKYLKDRSIIKETQKNLKQHPQIAEDISITRYGTASFIAEKVTQIVHLEKEIKLSDKIDRILLHKIWGLFITGLFFLTVFGVLLFFGNLTQGILMGLAENLLFFLNIAKHSIINMILIQGLTGLAAGISIALPYVFLFYFY